MTEAWVTRLWRTAAEHATHLTGAQVVEALATASEQVWDAGLDNAFDGCEGELTDRATAFDISWLSVFTVELSRRRSETAEK